MWTRALPPSHISPISIHDHVEVSLALHLPPQNTRPHRPATHLTRPLCRYSTSFTASAALVTLRSRRPHFTLSAFSTSGKGGQAPSCWQTKNRKKTSHEVFSRHKARKRLRHSRAVDLWNWMDGVAGISVFRRDGEWCVPFPYRTYHPNPPHAIIYTHHHIRSSHLFISSHHPC
jgi:hypothetical protein